MIRVEDEGDVMPQQQARKGCSLSKDCGGKAPMLYDATDQEDKKNTEGSRRPGVRVRAFPDTDGVQ
jgi:hypothetical protein